MPTLLRVGIVGLPNAGKSTLFNALTRSHQAAVAAYPFCTIEPNVGMIAVPAPRLPDLRHIFGAAEAIPAAVEFSDIAGLVAGASEGEGLGNQFLGHIREVDAIAHVVRCFTNENVSHVAATLDARRDVATIQTELALADAETLQSRVERVGKSAKAGDKTLLRELAFLEKLQAVLNAELTTRGVSATGEEQAILTDLHLLTRKPVVLVSNVGEDQLGTATDECSANLPADPATPVVHICADLEAEVIDLEPQDAADYFESVGIAGSGIAAVITAAYQTLGLITFFTGNEKEVRARALLAGTSAVAAAGDVHSDMAAGFIRAEVIGADDLLAAGSLATARERGVLRVEGRGYLVADGDVMYFRFNP